MRYALALFVGTVAGVLAASQPIADTDVWWHLATGHETIARGIVRTDVFAWTVRGSPVSTDQWLGQVVMYASWLLAGWRGVALLRVVLVVALIAFGAMSAMRRTTRPFAAVLATMPALLLTRAVWVDRPELFGFAFFAALLLLLRLGRDGRASALFASVPLIGVWANVHGSFALGVAVTLLVCAEGALRDVPRRRAYVATALAALTITLANPAGVSVWTAPGSHFLSPPRDIQEWGLIDVSTPLGIAYATTLALVLVAAFAGPRLEARELVVLVPVAFLSMTAVRQAPLLAVAAAPLFAERATAILALLGPHDRATEGPRAGRVPVATKRRETPRGEGFGRTVVLAVALGGIAVALATTPGQPDERAYPVGALGSIPTGDGTLARYEWGGWLIWNGVPVFVDGRLTPYAGGVLDDYRRIVAAAPGWEEAIARRHVRTLLVVPSDPVAVRATQLGWTVRARSDEFVVIAVP
ncbi:MAG TPA: hypothetical protein VFC31_15230 [Candidatus Limnocylindria bacterium]|nr:hypothetical protein [Candidatus Limnocylindria bacterium]